MSKNNPTEASENNKLWLIQYHNTMIYTYDEKSHAIGIDVKSLLEKYGDPLKNVEEWTDDQVLNFYESHKNLINWNRVQEKCLLNEVQGSRMLKTPTDGDISGYDEEFIQQGYEEFHKINGVLYVELRNKFDSLF